jgi:hypothetical protein
MLLKSNLDVQQTALFFVEQKLELKCSFKWGQINHNHLCEYGHTVVLFKSNLGVQQTALDLKLIHQTQVKMFREQNTLA